jgi:hypothetical protein
MITRFCSPASLSSIQPAGGVTVDWNHAQSFWPGHIVMFFLISPAAPPGASAARAMASKSAASVAA